MFGVQLWYEYHLADDHWSGSCWIRLPNQESADAYTAARPPGSSIQVRYCPSDAGRSVMLEQDQVDPDWNARWMQSPEL